MFFSSFLGTSCNFRLTRITIGHSFPRRSRISNTGKTWSCFEIKVLTNNQMYFFSFHSIGKAITSECTIYPRLLSAPRTYGRKKGAGMCSTDVTFYIHRSNQLVSPTTEQAEYRLKLEFSQATPRDLKVILMYETPSVMSVHWNGKVEFSHLASSAASKSCH